jgi:S-adenosylmethionine:tRNA ribosyltransferase-isomerase
VEFRDARSPGQVVDVPDMKHSPFEFELPSERIAQHPATQRDGARLLLVPREGPGGPEHRRVVDLPELLDPGDLLVVNRSRVFPARLRGRRSSGGRVELLLLAEEVGVPGVWGAIARPMRRLRVGEMLELVDSEGSVAAELEIRHLGDGSLKVAFGPGTDVIELAGRIGETPLPPYIERPEGPSEVDRDRYQTVFAREPGSIAAPTAGLHLSQRLLELLEARGVRTEEVLLHVGPATFLAGQPGRQALAVEPERYQVPARVRMAIERTRAAGNRVVAVGTTTTRALESAARSGWPTGLSTTDLVLSVESRFLAIDALLTNFHLPGSSLLSLVCGFGGVQRVESAYRAALAGDYRFYSYGDALLVL